MHNVDDDFNGSCTAPDMGEMSEQRQLNEKIRYRAVLDLGFYKTVWILKISFKHHLMNEIEIFKFSLNELEQCLNDIYHIISFKAVFLLLKQCENSQDFIISS
jgi:hypothetical protein